MKTTSKIRRLQKSRRPQKWRQPKKWRRHQKFKWPKKQRRHKKNLPPLKRISPAIFLMTSHLHSHRTTDIKPETLSGVETGNGTPHDKYNIHGIALVHTNRKDSIFMQRRLVQSVTYILELEWGTCTLMKHTRHWTYSVLRHFFMRLGKLFAFCTHIFSCKVSGIFYIVRRLSYNGYW